VFYPLISLMYYVRIFSELGNIDGINLWDALSEDKKSERTSIVLNIDDIWGSAAITVNQWKLVQGNISTV
jgi:hypothetical protein